MIPSCFQIYFRPIYLHLKAIFEIAQENNYAVLFISALFSNIGVYLFKFLEYKTFGVTNLIIILVLGTIVFNTYYGVKKSKKHAKEFREKSEKIKGNIPEKRALLKKAKHKDFSWAKLQFVMFKMITFLAYLFFVKTLLGFDGSDEDASPFIQVVDFTVEAFIKTPLFLFWYSEFKSIGENAEEIYGQKSKFFDIIENIVELKFEKLYKKDDHEKK